MPSSFWAGTRYGITSKSCGHGVQGMDLPNSDKIMWERALAVTQNPFAGKLRTRQGNAQLVGRAMRFVRY